MKVTKSMAIAIFVYALGTLIWLAWTELFGKLASATPGSECGFFFLHFVLAVASFGLLAYLGEVKGGPQ